MNHKISIKNLGPIKELSHFEVKNVNLMIGKSANGKSVLAKAVMLFNDVEFLDSLFFNPRQSEHLRRNGDLFVSLSSLTLLSQYFPSYSDYSILYHYTDKDFIEIKSNVDKNVDIKLSKELDKLLKKLLENVEREYIEQKRLIEYLIRSREGDNSDILEKLHQLERLHKSNSPMVTSSIRKELFEKLGIIETIFVPATRSFVSDFDDMRLSQLNSYQEAVNIGDKALRLFSETHRNLLLQFKKFSIESFNDLMRGEISKKSNPEDVLQEVISLTFDNQKLGIPEWSSGQKELFPILLILNHIIQSKKPHLLIIEEPESHLFPIDQRVIFEQIIEVTQQTSSKVFITTHSPYMLMSANNLIEAKRHNYQAYQNKFIGKDEINVYKLENGKAESLVDEEDGLVDGEYIEAVAHEIYDDFEKIFAKDS